MAASTNPPSRAGPSERNDDQADERKTVLEMHGYYLGRVIGTGSYATVKVARSDRHPSAVAIKIISKFHAPSDYLTKFLPREIEVVKGLKHPNLIRFIQAIETTHRVYIIMEYAQNGSLLDIIRRDHIIDERRSRHWFKQLLDGIEYCHNHGVVHRDIKCENLLMDQHYNIKLSDFGFARGQMKSKDGSIILSQTFCGSYAYASPEILRGVAYQPQMADIWSIGVVLYAMVYGCLPFDDKNHGRLIKQIHSAIKFPKTPKVSSACRSIISRMLTPQQSRARVDQLKNDNWVVGGVISGQRSSQVRSFNVMSTTIKQKTGRSNEHNLVDRMGLVDERINHKKRNR